MMHVIYNNDGSIKSKFLNEFVMQGSSYENVLFVAFENRSANTYALYAKFKLPNGSTTTVSSGSTPQTKSIPGVGIYTGKCISLSNAETLVAGALQMNIQVLTNDTEKVLVSFNTYITVNETGLQPNDPVIITAEEYQNLLMMVGNQVANYQCILKDINLAAFGDLNDYQVGQALYVSNSEECKLYEVDSNHDAVLRVNLLDKYTKAEIDTMMANKVDKLTGTTKVYALNNSGNLVGISYGADSTPSTIPMRDGSGRFKVESPSANKDVANKQYVDDAINTYAAYYITRNAAGDAFETRSQLMSATTFYSGGVVRIPTRNDYCYVLSDENHDNATTRYSYQNGQWEFQIVVNETSFTQAQLDAINSGATASKINAIENKVDKTTIALKLYCTTLDNQQSTISYINQNNAYTIPQRDGSGNIQVGATPSNNNDATSKSYVDSGLSAKFDKSNVVNASGSESSSNVYSSQYVKEQLANIAEVASGKTRTFSTSTSCTVADIEDAIITDTKVFWWNSEGNYWKQFNNVSEFTDWRTGKQIGLGSELEQLVNDLSITNILVTSSAYYWIFDSNDDIYLITQADYDKILSQNDNLMIIETNCPDRWVFGSHLYALETAKLGYHALGTSSDPMPFIETTIVVSTTPSLSLNSLETYECSFSLTSLTITSLVVSTNDDNPTWQISFKTHASTPFTITLPVNVTWAYGTPVFDLDTEYTIIIKKSVDSGYLAYLI